MQLAARLSNAVRFPWVGALVLGLFAWGCEPAPRRPPRPVPLRPRWPQEPAPEEALEPAPEATPLPAGIAPILEPFKGDLDGMLKRRVIRVLTVQNPILYFVDRGREIGITYETIKAFEKQLNEKLGNKIVTVHVVAIPVARDQLIPRLLAGRGRHRRRDAHGDARAEEAGGLLRSVRDRRAGGAGHRAQTLLRWRASTSSRARSSTSGRRAATPST